MLDFLIAGVQKGGTTALHAFLSQHPQIFLPARKELHFFDNEHADWSRPNYEPIERVLQKKTDDQVAGEATPIYTYWQPCAARIHRYNPTIKLIILLRHPVDRAYSHWAMEFARGSETLNFAQAIRDGRSRLNGEQHPVFSYVERGLYAEQTERLLTFFEPEQMLFVRTDDLRLRHPDTLDAICEFLGVDRFRHHPDSERIVPMQTPDVPPPSPDDIAYLTELYCNDLERLERLTGVTLHGSQWPSSR